MGNTSWIYNSVKGNIIRVMEITNTLRVTPAPGRSRLGVVKQVNFILNGKFLIIKFCPSYPLFL